MNMKSIAALACAVSTWAAVADMTPVMVSLVTPVQVPTRDYDVGGLRLSLIYGECRDFAGLDIGIAQRAAGQFTGIAAGGVNIADGRFYGGQIGLVNWSDDSNAEWSGRSTGAQVGLLNYAGAFCGLQNGFVNVTSGAFAGLQGGLVNCAGDTYGVQCGAYLVLGVNVAYGNVRGCQIGIVNFADTMDSGLQIGILNIIAHNGWAPVLPIVNGHF